MIKVRVYHAYYGCESGCCGHIVEIDDGVQTRERFEFDHGPDITWAREFAEEVIADHWPECVDSIDWSSMTFETSNY